MKPIRKIFALCVIVLSIIVFWLMPGVNTAKDTTYVRRYEDTSRESDSLDQKHSSKSNNTKVVRQKKLYKTEKIRSMDRFAKISPKVYSRAMQFDEIQYLTKDSIRSRDSLRSLVLRNMKTRRVDTATVVH
ncbi:hypothetical protein [Chryseolinea lacunae]|uniref:Uncharacterized protein n=1 Tax=Chryseolinea lacunae TaxID=2801331 RepID=A0ABS1KK53_9BACT|nr:hypothetical protein [Chryseolinea lacunae]MBL0739816.1 hypothetical protein [Chryseolinea lacunae]